jgi:hypothetical protein
MIEGARRLSRQNVTIRVPWHDTSWQGRVCERPSANTACLALKRIAAGKRPDQDLIAGQLFSDLEEDELPPCVDERVGFMSPFDLYLTKEHPYGRSNPDTHGHFAPTKLRLEAYSAACIPFGWMLRRAVEGLGAEDGAGLADALRLGYDPAREPDLGFATSWVQDKSNQLVLLDTFFGAIEPNASLCFFYAKQTPLSESHRRVIVGVARVTGVGQPTEYAYQSKRHGALEGMLWERCVRHSLRPESEDGFLMPYHAILEAAALNPEMKVEECVAFAPDEQFDSYSYGSEHLTDDGAIASLLSCAAALKAAADHSKVDVAAALQWIDRELGRLWSARGVHPGLGSALSAFGLSHGALLAHEIVRSGARDGEVFHALAFVDAIVANPSKFPEAENLGFGASFREKWRRLPPPRRALLDLVARCTFTPEQAERAYQPSARTLAPATGDADLLANPYLLFERDGAAADRIAFGVIDRGIFPATSVQAVSPLSSSTAMTDAIDRRRVRALILDLLEHAASEEGHSLLPAAWIVRRALGAPLDPKCTADEDVLAINADFLAEALAPASTASGDPAFKLPRYAAAKILISQTVRKRAAGARHALAHPWRALVETELKPIKPDTDPEERDTEQRAREEKAAALEAMACSRFSVLVGPAGSGKTTLLKILCDLPEVRDSVLLLAPTGKARVRLEEATRRLGQGKTLAQFLQRLARYDGPSQRYFVNPEAPREKGYRTVVVDECSMLTEDQMAALFDALQGVDRLILVGDPRQLPPIGAGRPFADIRRALMPPEQPPLFPRVAGSYAELTVIGRQRGEGRGDVLLARQFSGDPLDAGADEVWTLLSEGKLDHVRTVRWGGPTSIESVLTGELVQGLALAGPEDEDGFARSIGGSDFNGRVFFWPRRDETPGAGEAAHAWQILSPVRANLFGVDAINLAVQRRFRAGVKAWAQAQRYSKIPKPAGPQGLLWGDKVINVRNNGRRSTYPKIADAYVANGDIGVVVGGYRTANMKRRPRDLEVEFNSQPGLKFTYRGWEFGGDDGSPDIELAYALTVHKTQGSQFGQTFLVLPKNCRPLSRELLYTALTRHEDQLTILHEDEIGSLRAYTDPGASDLARRLTDLFVEPAPVQASAPGGPQFLDQHLLHRTSRGEFVRSKAELAIAEKLHGMSIDYSYEQPLELAGRTRWPDFTIEDDAAGVTYYWEHLGMLANPGYRRRWERKLQAYEAAGIRPLGTTASAARQLIITTEEVGRGLDMLEVERLAKIVVGAA